MSLPRSVNHLPTELRPSLIHWNAFFIQSHTADAADLMPSHAAVTMFRNVSEFLYAATNAATSPTSAKTTIPIGLAARTALSAAWTAAAALVMACHALVTAIHVVNAATMAPIPAAIGASQLLFSCNQDPKSCNVGMPFC